MGATAAAWAREAAILRFVRGPHLGKPDGELVAAQARNLGPGETLHLAIEPLRDAREQPVPHVVPQRVVHFLEAIQVDQQQRAVRAVAVQGGEVVFQPLPDAQAIGKARERIVVRQVLHGEELLLALELGARARREDAQQVLGEFGIFQAAAETYRENAERLSVGADQRSAHVRLDAQRAQGIVARKVLHRIRGIHLHAIAQDRLARRAVERIFVVGSRRGKARRGDGANAGAHRGS